MATAYEQDVVAWANEQARLLRAGRFELLDLAHLAEEIEDVGKSEQRELAHRMAVLLVHLLQWQYQAERRGNSWLRTIRAQRERIALRLERTPSLRACLNDSGWWLDCWDDAVRDASRETGLDLDVPDVCPWALDEILGADWLPEAGDA